MSEQNFDNSVELDGEHEEQYNPELFYKALANALGQLRSMPVEQAAEAA